MSTESTARTTINYNDVEFNIVKAEIMSYNRSVPKGILLSEFIVL